MLSAAVRQALLCQFVGAGECLTILEAAVDEFPGAAGGVLFSLLDCVKRLLAQLIREVYMNLPGSTSYVGQAVWKIMSEVFCCRMR
jgi:hypothetical protein